jgi:DNA-binding NtrC family response regulator
VVVSHKRITVLLVDDDPEIAQVVSNFLPPENYRIEVVGDGTLVLATVRHVRPDVILLDVHLPSVSGLELLRRIKSEFEEIPVIIVSGYVSTGNAIEAMKEGAFEYLTKPFRMAVLEEAIVRACGRPAGPGPSDDEDVVPGNGQIIGKSPEIVIVAKTIGQIADAPAPVLLMGESGTGKELVARAIHRNSVRHEDPFVVASCTASTEAILEVELFGGASYGEEQHRRRLGKLEEAGNGSIFLDEIADLPPAIQSRLLHALEDGRFACEGVGPIPLAARIIAATSRSLVELMKEGRFRVDLYYKLKIVTLYLPSLRDRRSDIPILSEYFIRKYSRLAHRPPKPLAKRTRDLLMRYHWPGNVRELENVIHTAVVLSRDAEFVPEDFPMLAELTNTSNPTVSPDRESYCRLFHQALNGVVSHMKADLEGHIYTELTAALDQALVERALEETGGNQVRAAQLLGVSRNTLRERMKRFSISVS